LQYAIVYPLEVKIQRAFWESFRDKTTPYLIN